MTTSKKEKPEDTQVTVIAEQDLSLYLLTKAEIDIAISTAKAFPRSVTTAMEKAISIATVNESVAASCTYAVPRDGKTIAGPSVRLAEIVCSCWGNMNSGARVIANDGKMITAQGVCHDLENNTRYTIEVQRGITKKDGSTFSMDMQAVTGNAACAIAFRNAVYKAVPMAVINEVWESAKDIAKGSLQTLPKRREKVMTYFKEKGVTEKEILTALNVKKVGDIGLDHLYLLGGMKTSFETGEATLETLFRNGEKNGTTDTAATTTVPLTEDHINNTLLNFETAANLTDLYKLKTDIKGNAELQKAFEARRLALTPNVKRETTNGTQSKIVLP